MYFRFYFNNLFSEKNCLLEKFTLSNVEMDSADDSVYILQDALLGGEDELLIQNDFTGKRNL